MREIPREDREAIEALVLDYASALDHRRWHDIVDLCTEDAVLLIRGREIVGRSGLEAWAERRAEKATRRTLHQMTNLRLEAVSKDEATGVAALVLHIAQTGGHKSFVDLIGEYRDEYVWTADGWKFRRRHLVRLEDF